MWAARQAAIFLCGESASRGGLLRRGKPSFLCEKYPPPAGGFCAMKTQFLLQLKKVCAWRTLAPERGCVSSHIPLRGVRLPPEAFVS